MGRILLVEDDAPLGEGVKAGLDDAGHSVDWVRDGRHGREALATGEFTAVVLDLGLPRLDAGADDYLVKPFALEELKARVRSLARRSTGRASNRIAHRGVEIDLAPHSRAILSGNLTEAQAASIGAAIEGRVASIVADCKLPPEADANLHLVVADLLEAAEVLQGRTKKKPERHGARGACHADVRDLFRPSRLEAGALTGRAA